MSKTQKDLDQHMQLVHHNVSVEITTADQAQVQCDQCEYKCRLNIQLKKHKRTVHVAKQEELKYKCDMCSYSTDFILHFCEHRQAEHPNLAPIFKPKSDNMALSLLAEQNMDIIDDLGSLKTIFQGVFLEFADKVGAVLENVRDDILEKTSETKAKVNELDT